MYTPKILVTCISEDKSISFVGCVARFFFSAGLAYSECYLLAAMTYDHYMAISKPLLYSPVMPIGLSAFFIAASYLGGFINAFIVTKGPSALNFCSNNAIDDFFCYIPPLVKLACGRKDAYQVVLFCVLASNVITPTVLIPVPYLFTTATILKIRSPKATTKPSPPAPRTSSPPPCSVAPFFTFTLVHNQPIHWTGRKQFLCFIP